MPTTATTNEFLTAARGMGLAEKDFAVVFEVLAQMSGVHAMSQTADRAHEGGNSGAGREVGTRACTGRW